MGVIAIFALPRIAGWDAQVIHSEGMEPALRTGGVAMVGSGGPEDVAVGDIITFRQPDKPDVVVTHRVVGVLDADDGRAFRTKGDANEAVDSWLVPAANVEGTVVFSVPYLGRVVDRAHTRWGFALLVGVPALLIAAYEVSNIVRARRRARVHEEPVLPQPVPELTVAERQPAAEPVPAPAPQAPAIAAPVAPVLIKARPEPALLAAPSAQLLAAPAEAFDSGHATWARADLWPSLPSLPEPPSPLRSVSALGP
ncbi:MAG: signal peptidase I [Dehalococcoidia bacterium]